MVEQVQTAGSSGPSAWSPRPCGRFPP
jgi:hypothetical protein